MEVTVTESGPCRKTVAIVVPPEKIQAQVADAYKAASKKVQIKGFRPGKVPRQVLEKRFGQEILSEAKETLVRTSFEDALREHKLKVLGQPELEGLDETPLDESSPLL